MDNRSVVNNHTKLINPSDSKVYPNREVRLYFLLFCFDYILQLLSSGNCIIYSGFKTDGYRGLHNRPS